MKICKLFKKLKETETKNLLTFFKGKFFQNLNQLSCTQDLAEHDISAETASGFYRFCINILATIAETGFNPPYFFEEATNIAEQIRVLLQENTGVVIEQLTILPPDGLKTGYGLVERLQDASGNTTIQLTPTGEKMIRFCKL